MFLQPRDEIIKPERIGFVQADEERVCRIVITVDKIPVQAQKIISDEECDALVAVDEWVIVGQASHNGGGFLNQAIVLANLRSQNGRLQSSQVQNSVCAAEGVN